MSSLPVSSSQKVVRGQKVHGIVKFSKLFLLKFWISTSHAEHENSHANINFKYNRKEETNTGLKILFFTGAVEAKLSVVANFICSSKAYTPCCVQSATDEDFTIKHFLQFFVHTPIQFGI